jgi:hypothetical protein
VAIILSLVASDASKESAAIDFAGYAFRHLNAIGVDAGALRS